MVEVDRYAPPEVVKSVVGLKADGGAEGSAVSAADAAAFASKHGALCARCSARDGAHITPLFEALAERVVKNGFDPDGTRRRGGGQGGAVRIGDGRAGGKKAAKPKCC